MNKLLRKIPLKYIDEFVGVQTTFIKNRVRLLGALSIGIYIFSSVINYIIYPVSFNPQELPLIVSLLVIGSIIMFLNFRAKTLFLAKLNAYLFILLIVVIVTKVCIVYCEYAGHSASIYVFMLFLASFTIPWLPMELLPIGFFHVLAYSFFYYYVQMYLPESVKEVFGVQTYMDGSIFLVMSFSICFIIRRNDAERDIENFILFKEIDEKRTQMQQELELATKVHKTLIPESVVTDKVEIAVLYLPNYYIGGDYAKYHFVNKNMLLFIMCDITGHGVSSALLVNRLHTEFELNARDDVQPGLLLKEINDFITKDFQGTNMYMSAFCGLLDFKKKVFAYSNHGHPDQYLYSAKKQSIKHLASQGRLLGLPFGTDEISQSEVDFGHGDQVLLFTDGVTETKSLKGEMYGEERLETFVKENASMQTQGFNQKLLNELEHFSKQNFEDDIFILNIKVK